MGIRQELNYKLYMQREENIRHLDYDKEFSLYKAIASGNKAGVIASRERYFNAISENSGNEKNGMLSDDPVQNEKYHFAIMAAMIARFCVDGGLNHETAYNLSDIYIQKADKCTAVAPIEKLRTEMIFEFTDQMQGLQKSGVYSKHIVKCIDYIYDNLNKKLNVNTLADYLDMNPTYLSKLFMKETGKSLSTYIKEQRLTAAANLLKYSDYSITEIAEYFNFSSQSHFTNVFQTAYDLTPKKYRDTYAKKSMQ